MREAEVYESERGIRVGGRVLNNLRYADDTTLVAESEDDLRELIQTVESASEKAGLYLNIKKTKVMANGILPTFNTAKGAIEVVDHFNLLGSVIESAGGCGMELARRLALGRAAMGGLSKIWRDKDISICTKIRLVQCLVFPVFTYGSETWALNKAQTARVKAFEQW